MSHTESYRETIVYGGAFNPPTRAHQAILQACVDYASRREADVWLLPSATRADKHIETSVARRLRLCEALARDIVRYDVEVRVDTTELDRGVQTETYDTVREFVSCYPDRAFTWVFGSDSVATMSSWHGGEWMYDNLAMLVVERPGSPAVALGRYAHTLAVESTDISSTLLRARMDMGERYDDLVGPEVGAVLAVQ